MSVLPHGYVWKQFVACCNQRPSLCQRDAFWFNHTLWLDVGVAGLGSPPWVMQEVR